MEALDSFLQSSGVLVAAATVFTGAFFAILTLLIPLFILSIGQRVGKIADHTRDIEQHLALIAGSPPDPPSSLDQPRKR